MITGGKTRPGPRGGDVADTTTTTNETTGRGVAADAGRCLGCRYPLRDLPANRCPECGRAFDPTDSSTTYLPGADARIGRARRRLRAARARAEEVLIGPIHPAVRTVVLVGAAAVLWGRAWLPGAMYVEAAGWTALAGAVLYGIVHRDLRRRLRARRGLEPIGLPASERYRRRHVLLVALAMAAPLTSWPLRVSLWAHRPLLDRFGWHVYAEAPMVDPPGTPRMVGLLVLSRVQPNTDGATLSVAGGGRVHYVAEGGRGPFRPWYADRTPWYLWWVLPPMSGRWATAWTDP
jgi:hypothetical protein